MSIYLFFHYGLDSNTTQSFTPASSHKRRDSVADVGGKIRNRLLQ